MQEALDFLVRHGYSILFAAVLVEQIGMPIPSVPLLLGVGALSAEGRFSFGAALIVALAASLPADAAWFYLGRKRGYGVLRVLCRISLEQETCVTSTTGAFHRHGAGTLAVAKFIPGLSTVAPPLAGMLHMTLGRFLLLDGIGAALWAAAYLGLGYVFRTELEWVARMAAGTGASLAVLVALAFGGYIGWKWLDRRRFLRKLDVARIAPEELRSRIEAGEEVVILDLRHPPDVEEQEATLPGAIRLPAQDLEARHKEIPRDREIVVYCS
jgi:membrane protein DedA with SNARE-associated domain